MNLFELKPAGGSPIEIFDHIPEKFKPSAHTMFKQAGVEEDFGTFHFQHYAAGDFTVWFSRYSVDKTITLRGRSSLPIIECCVPMLNYFLSDIKSLGSAATRSFEVCFIHVPEVDNTATLQSGKLYETLDFHFLASFLLRYDIYDEVKVFLDKVDAKLPAKLIVPCLLTRDMRKILMHLISFEVRPELFAENMKSWITIFLSQVFRTLDKPVSEPSKYITPLVMEKADKARIIVETEYKNPLTVAQVAKRVQLNSTYLQAAFKLLTQYTFHDYLLRVRMAKAEALLINKTENLNVLAAEVGYADKYSFSKFFSKFHNQSPERFRNQHKKKN